MKKTRLLIIALGLATSASAQIATNTLLITKLTFLNADHSTKQLAYLSGFINGTRVGLLAKGDVAGPPGSGTFYTSQSATNWTYGGTNSFTNYWQFTETGVNLKPIRFYVLRYPATLESDIIETNVVDVTTNQCVSWPAYVETSSTNGLLGAEAMQEIAEAFLDWWHGNSLIYGGNDH